MTRHPAGTLSTLATATGADRAIVIGGSIGGLLAARALADHVSQVIVLDRDTFPDAPAHRRNVPQGQHVHALLARGRVVAERLFPGIGDELVASGAILANSRRDLTWYQQGGYHREPRRGLTVLVQSRPLLEHHIRRRVAALPNVTMLDGCRVTGLLATRDRARVSGVRVTTAADPDREHELRAALTVDASGRGSRLPAWLAGLGVDVPAPVTAGVDARYATRHFRRAPSRTGPRAVTVIVASPETRRGGVMLAQEGDRWLVTLSGRGGQQPPTELSAFIEYAMSLEAPDISDGIRQAIPLDDGVSYHCQPSTRRHYERIDRFPAGILPFADAICAFNPIYAQGMTVAAIEADALAACLAAGTHDLARRFFASVVPSIDVAWTLAASGDLRFAEGAADLPQAERLVHGYMARLLVAAQRDPVVADAFHRVTNLVDAPRALFRPDVALRVALAGRPGTTRRPGPAAPRGMVAPAAD
jgi:2-polyprenyl-6-methoxyphenol hydroxylase-like FAD-dependent oxidoreductase